MWVPASAHFQFRLIDAFFGSLRLTALLRVVIVSLLVAPAFSLPARSDFTFTSWTADDGLPQNTVLSILQTADGYLWFTTLDGVVRYDGVRFSIFNRSNTPGLSSNRFNSLAASDAGDLWMGTEDAGITRLHGGRFTTYTTADGLPHDRIEQVLADGRGVIVVTPGGAVRWEGSRFVAYPIPADEPLRPARSAVHRDRSGVIWDSNEAGVHRFERQSLTRRVVTGDVNAHEVTVLHDDTRGRLWIGTLDDGVRLVEQGTVTSYGIGDGLPHPQVTAIHTDRRGEVWVGTRSGLARFEDGRFTSFTTADGLTSNYVCSLHGDREGNLWVGTNDGGLSHLTPRVVRTWSATDGLADDNVYPILQDSRGTTWIGTNDGSVTRYRDGRFTRLLSPSGQPYDATTSLSEDREGRLWIAKLSSIWIYDNGRLERHRHELPLDASIVRAMHHDAPGSFWMATSTGLLRQREGNVTRYTTVDGLAGNDVHILLPSGERLWIGTYGGVSFFERGRIVSVAATRGLRVRALHEDEKGVLWIGTYDGGLARLSGDQLTRYTVADGLFNDGVFAILPDDHGNFWMTSNRGIHRVSRQQLEDFAAGRIDRISSVSYGRQDGLLNIECNGGRQPAGWRMRDGTLWFPTQGGVAVVDPQVMRGHTAAPPVLIEQCLLQRQPVDFSNGIEVRPRADNLEIHYAALSFIRPDQIRFRYRLEGVDTEWVEAGNRRVAYYAHLPAGRHTFRVIAANADGVWNLQGAAVEVVVIPPFWRTWWFTLLITSLVVAIALALFAWRVGQLRRAHAEQAAFSRRLIESQEVERKRIAAELHDSLGQNLLIIKNRALIGSRTATEQQAAREQFELISSSASQAIDEVRQIAFNLRPYHLDRLGLTQAIEAMVEKVAQTSGIVFTVDLDDIDGLLPPDTEINIYRAIQECVNNVVKHSEASHARVVIRKCEGSLEIEVADNGRGFDAEQSSSRMRGFGLAGIAERIRMVGGSHRLISREGNGTSVSIRIALQERVRQNG